jgi:hypothetical protein
MVEMPMVWETLAAGLGSRGTVTVPWPCAANTPQQQKIPSTHAMVVWLIFDIKWFFGE